MKKNLLWSLPVLLVGLLVLIAGPSTSASGQTNNTQATPKANIGQQKQLDELMRLDVQLQKDRDELHQAITQSGWDSEQTDAAQQKLEKHRAEYRQLRRSLRSAGVAVPPPSGFAAGPAGGGPRTMAGRGMHHGAGRQHGCAGCDCPCCRD
ncbi:MAG: hypothetical protein ACE145_13450 [Terriglobia bacterium]